MISRKLVLGLILLSVAGCGGSSGFNTLLDESEDADETSAPALVLDNITPITFDENGEATVTIANASSEDQYLIALYSSNHESSGSLFAYQIGSGGPSNISSSLTTRGMEEVDVTEDAHELLRISEEELDGDRVTVPQGRTRSLSRAASVESIRTFKVLDSLTSTSSSTTVTAELRYESSNFYVYVDTRNSDVLTDAEIEEMAAPFAALVDDEEALFGNSPDVNGDGHFVILLTQAVNELGTSGGGIITGFFYAVDLYSDSSYPVSNEMEIIYTMVPDPEGDHGVPISKEFALSNILPSVLPHEYQHMISYNQHVFVNGGASEKSYLNEALAHLAEDIYSLSDGYMVETGIENPARVAYYLDDVDSVCFTCGSSLSQRGGSYLFVRYLYEQAQLGNLSGVSNGAGLIGALLNTSRTGMENIVGAALGSSDTDDFEGLMGLYGLAVYLSGMDLSTDNRFDFTGIDLWGIQNDNRGTDLDGPNTVAPSSYPYQSTIAASGLSFLEISGDDVLSLGGSFPVSLGSEMTGGGYLVTLK